jgi:glycosyltransferase involved in cell wall biosynthesis
MEWCIHHYGTMELACSNKAGAALFGTFGADRRPWSILSYAIDLTPFGTWTDPSIVRKELGIADDALVVGHVGRFDHQKNHTFMIDIARELGRRAPNMVLLFVGDGPLRNVIERRVAEAGLTGQVVLTGVRSDVPRLMSAMTVFLFPSLFEGLGLVFVEAQAAGLPCVVADVIPKEADVVEDLIIRMSLSQPASAWADAILAATQVRRWVSPHQALAGVRASPFGIHSSAERIEELYSSVHS